MKMKSIVGVVLCVLLTASVSQAAYSQVIISGGQLTWSGWQQWGPDSPTDLSGGWLGAEAVANLGDGLVEDGPNSTTKSWDVGVLPTDVTTTYAATMSVQEILSVLNPGDWAETKFEMVLEVLKGTTVIDSDSYVSDPLSAAYGDLDVDVVTDIALSVTDPGSGMPMDRLVRLTATAWAAAEVEEQPVDPPTTVPAPGAVLLGSLGAGLVGWLRRKKSL